MIEGIDVKGYDLQSCVYLLDSLIAPVEVFYLYKTLKPKEPTYMKLIGWGGNFEDVDNGDRKPLIVRGYIENSTLVEVQ